MNREIEQDEMRHALEVLQTRDPGLIPLQIEIQGPDLTDPSTSHRLPEVTEVRGPAPILIHREPQARSFCESDQFPALRQIQHERLLTQYMLSGQQSRPDQRDAVHGMGRDVQHGDVRPLQQGNGLRRDLSFGKKGIPSCLRLGQGPIRDRNDVPTCAGIGFEVEFADPSGPDQSDPVSTGIAGARRQIVHRRCLDDPGLLHRTQSIVVFRHGQDSIAQAHELHELCGGGIGFLDPLHYPGRVRGILQLDGDHTGKIQILDRL